jgi:hypothetical protein
LPTTIDEERYWAFMNAPTRSYDASEVLAQLKFIVANWDTRYAQDLLTLGTTFFPDLGWDGGAMREFRRLVNRTFGISLPASTDVLNRRQKLSDYRKLVNAALASAQRFTA